MLSCWGSLDRLGSIGNGFIAFLLSDDEVTVEGSPESMLDEKVVQGHKSAQRSLRFAHPHARAGHRVKHPGRELDDLSWMDLDTGDRPVCTILHALKAQPSSEMRMPWIMNGAICPDMGRMNTQC